VLVFDPLEAELPPPGRYTLRSADGGPPLRLDTTDPELRARHRAAFAARRATLASLARQAGVSAHELPVDAHAAPLGVGISAGSGAGSGTGSGAGSGAGSDGIRPATARPS
jgi:hypothetical protein